MVGVGGFLVFFWAAVGGGGAGGPRGNVWGGGGAAFTSRAFAEPGHRAGGDQRDGAGGGEELSRAAIAQCRRGEEGERCGVEESGRPVAVEAVESRGDGRERRRHGGCGDACRIGGAFGAGVDYGRGPGAVEGAYG